MNFKGRRSIFFDWNYSLHLFGIETPKHNLFLRKNLKIGKKYAVVASVGGDVVVDEQYGNTYRLTVKPEEPEQNNLLTLAKGTASGKNIVFYVYRPDGASDAFLYFAGQNNVWTSTDKTSVTISADGWTRVEFAAEDVVNADWTTYWYIYLKDKNVSEESGWLISDIYAY